MGSLSHCLAAGNDYMYKPGDYGAVSLNRSSFPPGFLFRTSSAAYQVIILNLGLIILFNEYPEKISSIFVVLLFGL